MQICTNCGDDCTSILEHLKSCAQHSCRACKQTGFTLNELQNHVLQCENAQNLMIGCRLCGVRLPLAQLQKHVSTECMMYFWKCKFCKSEVRPGDMPKHVSTECPLSILRCPYKDKHNRCVETVQRKDLTRHLESVHGKTLLNGKVVNPTAKTTGGPPKIPTPRMEQFKKSETGWADIMAGTPETPETPRSSSSSQDQTSSISTMTSKTLDVYDIVGAAEKLRNLGFSPDQVMALMAAGEK